MQYGITALRLFLGLLVVPVGLGFLYYIGFEVGKWQWASWQKITYPGPNLHILPQLYFYVFTGLAAWVMIHSLKRQLNKLGQKKIGRTRKIFVTTVTLVTLFFPHVAVYLLVFAGQILALGFIPFITAIWFNQKVTNGTLH